VHISDVQTHRKVSKEDQTKRASKHKVRSELAECGRKELNEMVTVRDVDQSALVRRAAQDLAKKLTMPDWAKFVKTGVHKERPPEDSNWWYMRAASIMRNVYLNGPVGVERLRTVYGGKKSLGHQPTHTRKAGGKVIRAILQDLERAKLVESVTKPKRGRKITREGQRFLDNIARDVKV